MILLVSINQFTLGIRIQITSAEIRVKPPIKAMTVWMLNQSARIPVSSAPMAYPPSLHKRKIPMLFARSKGWVWSAILAKKVG